MGRNEELSLEIAPTKRSNGQLFGMELGGFLSSLEGTVKFTMSTHSTFSYTVLVLQLLLLHNY